MPRISAVDPETVTGTAADLLEDVEDALGIVPNVVRTVAHSPAALKAFLGMNEALGGGVLPARLREKIALLVSELNGSRYCLAAHSLIGRTVGLSDAAITESRHGRSADEKEAAVLRLARQVVEKRGRIADAELTEATAAGLTEAELVELLAHIALTTFTNYLNRVADTDLDFPAVRALGR
jgi:uncharacterized peroxidase-related enzyme